MRLALPRQACCGVIQGRMVSRPGARTHTTHHAAIRTRLEAHAQKFIGHGQVPDGAAPQAIAAIDDRNAEEPVRAGALIAAARNARHARFWKLSETLGAASGAGARNSLQMTRGSS